MAIAVDRVLKYLMSKIDEDDFSAVEIVQRYVGLMGLYRLMQTKVKKDGPTIEVKNGEQSYTKAHPLINDIKNINAQLLNIKKDIDRYMKEYEEKLRLEAKKNEYDSNDLL